MERNGEMDLVIIVHTGNNSKSRCKIDRIGEIISKVTFSHSTWGHLAKRKNGDWICGAEKTGKYLNKMLGTFSAPSNRTKARPASKIIGKDWEQHN